MPYEVLSVSALAFVVDTPVPITELAWVSENVKGSRTNWARKFSDIEYDQDRYERGAYNWERGSYTLANIEEYGGICVDQAYYAAMTARALGIPAIYFRGIGKRGGHAWFGYMKSQTNWEMDVGRYIYDDYITGTSIHPQTNRPMTDHDVEYNCDRILYADQFARATAYGRLGRALLEMGDLESADYLAGRAARLAQLYDPAWQIQETVLRRRKQLDACLRLLEAKERVFSRYPDYLIDIAKKKAEILIQLGRGVEAQRVLATALTRLGRHREDLAGELRMHIITQLVAAGQTQEARSEFEKLLEQYQDSGQKAFPLIQHYLAFTKQTGQTEEGVRFLSRYLKRVGGLAEEAEGQLDIFLIQAYENNGDTVKADRLRNRL
jgi:tetratricopeptide (TPR) repeat protein